MSLLLLDEERVDQFFADARERQAIYLRRKAGNPRPWTQDSVMSQFRITNVFREQDKTTTWLRENVRGPLADYPEVLPAVALARWFNLISTMKTLFVEPSQFAGRVDDAAATAGLGGAAPDGRAPASGYEPPLDAAGSSAGLLRTSGPRPTPWQEFLRAENVATLEWPLRKQGSPWVTGAYMIRTPIGMDKLEGVLSSFRNLWTQRPKFELNSGEFVSMGWQEVAAYCLTARNMEKPVSLYRVWDWLRNFYGLGAFMAYEIVTDLRHTKLLDRAPDINTWANPGPGALRGSNILLGKVNRVRKGRLEKCSVAEAKAVMDELLVRSRDPRYWPQERTPPSAEFHSSHDTAHAKWIAEEVPGGFEPGAWPVWELHEVEMWCCETAKLVRTREGFGRPRGNYP